MEKKRTITERYIDANDKVLTIKEAAKILGITPCGVRKRIYRNMLPRHKQGKRLYLLHSDLVGIIRDL